MDKLMKDGKAVQFLAQGNLEFYPYDKADDKFTKDGKEYTGGGGKFQYGDMLAFPIDDNTTSSMLESNNITRTNNPEGDTTPYTIQLKDNVLRRIPANCNFKLFFKITLGNINEIQYAEFWESDTIPTNDLLKGGISQQVNFSQPLFGGSNQDAYIYTNNKSDGIDLYVNWFFAGHYAGDGFIIKIVE